MVGGVGGVGGVRGVGGGWWWVFRPISVLSLAQAEQYIHSLSILKIEDNLKYFCKLKTTLNNFVNGILPQLFL